MTNNPFPEPVNDKREEFVVIVNCQGQGCGQTGSIVWQKNRGNFKTDIAQRSLILVSAGFHTSGQFAQSGDPEILCDRCDTPLPA